MINTVDCSALAQKLPFVGRVCVCVCVDPPTHHIAHIMQRDKVAGHRLLLCHEGVNVGPTVVSARHTGAVLINWLKVGSKFPLFEVHLTPRNQRHTKALQGQRSDI